MVEVTEGDGWSMHDERFHDLPTQNILRVIKRMKILDEACST